MTVAVRIHRRPDGDYVHRCYRTDDGIHRQDIGCQHVTPREAIRHADSLAEPYVSPRRSAEPPDPSSSAPLVAAQVGGSAEVRRRTSRLVRTGRR